MQCRVQLVAFLLEKFNQTTKYTYILNNISDKDSLWKKISSQKRQIKKQKNNVQIKMGLDFDIFFDLVKLTFQDKIKNTLLL